MWKLIERFITWLYGAPVSSDDNFTVPSYPNLPDTPLEAPVVAQDESIVAETVSVPLLWETPKQAWHSTRVLCDEMGLPLRKTVLINGVKYFPKDEVCATIYGESEFKNGAVCINKDKNGKETSRDVGLCQWNSYWHCGKGKTFPSTAYVVANPEKAVRKMIEFYKAGNINLWVAHKSGRYAQFVPKSSKMWKLAV